MFDIAEHMRQIQKNLEYENAKPVLREQYWDFHDLIADNLFDMDGEAREFCFGIGNIKEVLPYCVRTDLFSNPWIGQQECPLGFRSTHLLGCFVLQTKICSLKN